MAKRQRKTANQQSWDKEIKRLKQFVRRAEKRGFSFPEGIIPDKPQRITKAAIERLKGLNPKKLYDRATYTTETGERITGTEGRFLERSRASKKGKKGKKGKRPERLYVVLKNVREMIKTWSPSQNWSKYYAKIKEHDKNICERMLEGAILQEGEDVIGERLEEHAVEVNSLVGEMLYGSGGKDGSKMQGNFARFANILYGRKLSGEESKEIAEAEEYLEDYEEDY